MVLRASSHWFMSLTTGLCLVLGLALLSACSGTISAQNMKTNSDSSHPLAFKLPNQCDDDVLDRGILSPDGHVVFLNKSGAPVLSYDPTTTNINCAPEYPEKSMELSIAEVNALTHKGVSEIEAQKWVVSQTSVAALQQQFGRLCQRHGLATVFEVSDIETADITGCQKDPSATKALMIEFKEDGALITITMMWPAPLSEEAMAINAEFSAR